MALSKKQKIKLYTLSTCTHCLRSKKFFRDEGIEVDITDVDLLTGDERQKVMDEVRKLNPECTFPTICIDDKVVIGFNEERIRKALGDGPVTAEELHSVLSRYAESQGIRLNKDREFVLDILRGLLTNEQRYGYRSCPCRLAWGEKEKDKDIVCPCVYRDPDVKEYGSCYCELYVSVEQSFRRLLFELTPNDPALPEVHYQVAESQFQTGQYLEAAREFRQIADSFAGTVYAPLALLRAGDANLRMWKRPELDPAYGEAALAIYQELVGRYPGSNAAARANLHVRELKERFALKAYKTGLFYQKRRAYDSAIIYFKQVIAAYPESTLAPQALLRLVEIYRAIFYVEELEETCAHLRRYYPDLRGLAETLSGAGRRAVGPRWSRCSVDRSTPCTSVIWSWRKRRPTCSV